MTGIFYYIFLNYFGSERAGKRKSRLKIEMQMIWLLISDLFVNGYINLNKYFNLYMQNKRISLTQMASKVPFSYGILWFYFCPSNYGPNKILYMFVVCY